jgi:hypothetical protein
LGAGRIVMPPLIPHLRRALGSKAAKAGLVLLILNEVRGVLTVAVTWPVWWPLIEAAWRSGAWR